MPLETLGDKEALNIKRLETPEPAIESRSLFDFEAEATSETWEELYRYLEEDIKDPTLNEFFTVRLMELFPDKADELEGFRNGGSYYPDQIAKERQKKITGRTTEFMQEAYKALIMHPELSRQELGILESDWDLFREFLKNPGYVDIVNLKVLVDRVEGAMVIFPEHQSELFLGEQAFSILFEKLNADYNPNLDQSVLEYANLASQLRTLFPDQFTRSRIVVLDWQSMKETLERKKQTDLFDYSALLLAMRTLSAASVKITGHGLDFIDAEPEFKKDLPPMPEVKK